MPKLNIGCGRDIRDGWDNLDQMPLPGVNIVYNLDGIEEAIPNTPNDTYDEMYMSHTLEHLMFPLTAMQRLWRIAAPGCRMIVRVPYGSSDNAWEDPTHVRPYYAGSFLYFSQLAYARADYGYRGDWKTISRKLVVEPDLSRFSNQLEHLFLLITRGRNLVLEMIVELEAVKPARNPLCGEVEKSPISFQFGENATNQAPKSH